MAWARTQEFAVTTQFTSVPVASTATTLASAVAVGDTILLATTVGADIGGSVTDQLGNVYTQLTAGQGGALYDAPNGQRVDACWCIVTHAGTPTITYTPTSSSPWLAITGSHFTGSTTSSTRRDSKGQVQTQPGTTTDIITSTSVAAVSGDLLWGGSGFPGSQNGFFLVSGTGFTTGTLNGADMMDEYKTASGAGAATFTDATDGALNVYHTIGIAISPGGAGGGGVLPDDGFVIIYPVTGPSTIVGIL